MCHLAQVDTEAWSNAARAATALIAAEDWRTRLAGAVRAAAGVPYAHVWTCAPCSPIDYRGVTDPPELVWVIEQVRKRFMPAIEAHNVGWRHGLDRYGLVYPMPRTSVGNLAEDMQREVLTPAGIEGFASGLIVDPDKGLLGAVAVGSERSTEHVLERMAAPLAEIVTLAAQTLGAALDLASGCGAVSPARPGARPDLPLTPRERQVSELVAEGYTNLNVAARLGIAEQTVHVHLRRIYGRLGIHSRTELARLVLGPERTAATPAPGGPGRRGESQRGAARRG